MRSRKNSNEKRDLSNGLANFTEQNRQVMLDISPRKRRASCFDQDEVSSSPLDNTSKKVGLLQPLKMLREQIQKRQQKVIESIEEHKKITSSNQILKSSQQVVGNDKQISPQNSAYNLKFESAFRNLASMSNSQSSKNSPSSFKLGIFSQPKNQTNTIEEERDSILSTNSLGNNKQEIKSRKTKKLQNIFRVITMMNKKMKIKKKDKDTVFFNRYIKEYENVDTYFNVKQVFQQLNPLNNPNPQIVKRLDDLIEKKDVKNNVYQNKINEDIRSQVDNQERDDNEEDKGSSSDEDVKMNDFQQNQSSGQKPKGISLLKKLFQKNSNQLLQGNVKSIQESKFAQQKVQKKINLEEMNTENLIRLLENLQDSYQIEQIKVKEDEEENQDNIFYDSLHKQLMKAISEEPNYEKTSNKLNFWQERELETINFQIKKAHEQNRKIGDLRNIHDQSLIENKYLEFKKKSDQALKLLKKGGYKIYKSKLKQIEEEEKINRHILETIQRFEQFDKKIKYKPMHHQHFSHRSIHSQKQISAVLDNQVEVKKKKNFVADRMMQEFLSKNRKSIVCSSLPYSEKAKSTSQSLNKSFTQNVSKSIHNSSENVQFQRNEGGFQLNKENIPLIDMRKSSLTSNQSKLSSQFSIKQNPRKTIGFKDQKQSPRNSRQSIESNNTSKIVQKSIQEIYITEQNINLEEQQRKQSDQMKKKVVSLDMSLINQQYKQDSIITSNSNKSIQIKTQSPFSKGKRNSNKSIQLSDHLESSQKNIVLSSNISPTFNSTHQSHMRSFPHNFSPFNKKNKLKKLNSFTVNSSPTNQNQRQVNFQNMNYSSSLNINKDHQRRNTIMNVFSQNKKQTSTQSQFSNQQSPKNVKINEESMPLISSFSQPIQSRQIENIKQNDDDNNIQQLRRRSTVQHKTVVVSSPTQLQRKMKRINTVHFQENNNSPKTSNFSKELAAQYKQQNYIKYSPQLSKAKSLINQIFKKQDRTQMPLIKEKEFFPQLDFYRQKSFLNLEDTFYQSHQSFCTAVDKRNKQIQNQYSQLKQKVVNNSQSLSETPTHSSQFYNATSLSQNQKSNQLTTFYSSKSPLILLKDHMRKVSAFQQKYSNKLQTLLYDLDFAQEENTFVKGQMIKTVNDSCKSFEQITSQISPQLECLRDLLEQSAVETKNKKPFIQKPTLQKKS